MPTDWMWGPREREESRLAPEFLVGAFPELGRQRAGLGWSKRWFSFGCVKFDRPLRCFTKTSNKTVGETGLELGGEFGARIKFGDTGLDVGGKEEREARDHLGFAIEEIELPEEEMGKSGDCLSILFVTLKAPDPSPLPGNAQNTLAQPTVWLTIVLTTVVCIMPVVAFRFLKLNLKPDLSDTVRSHPGWLGGQRWHVRKAPWLKYP